jgi:hypothetical protein
MDNTRRRNRLARHFLRLTFAAVSLRHQRTYRAQGLANQVQREGWSAQLGDS